MSLRQEITDSWTWKAANGGKYSMSTYTETRKDAEDEREEILNQAFKWILSNIAPHKASVVA